MGAPLIQPYELDAFIEKYIANGFNFAAAARAIGRSSYGMRDHMRRNEEFAARVRDAKLEMFDEAVAEAYKRAVLGYDEPLAHQGQLTGDTVRKYSDALLVKFLAAHPDFAERAKLELSNPDGSLTASDAQVAARIASILAVAQARKARGEVIVDAEIVEPAALPSPHEDLL